MRNVLLVLLLISTQWEMPVCQHSRTSLRIAIVPGCLSTLIPQNELGTFLLWIMRCKERVTKKTCLKKISLYATASVKVESVKLIIYPLYHTEKLQRIPHRSVYLWYFIF
jgi:hypothetical protein